MRYSEDIDLVRTAKGRIKEIIDGLRDCLEPWLGQPKTRQTGQSFKLLFYFSPEVSAALKQKIKIKINIHESFAVLERAKVPFSVQSTWFSQKTKVNTFQLEELLATKLRALYERKKGRDAFDLWLAIKEKEFDDPKTMAVFTEYMARSNKTITKKLFADNLNLKLQDATFLDDIEPMLAPRLKNNHSRPIGLLTQQGNIMVTEGWSLSDAVETIKDTFIDWLYFNQKTSLWCAYTVKNCMSHVKFDRFKLPRVAPAYPAQTGNEILTGLKRYGSQDISL